MKKSLAVPLLRNIKRKREEEQKRSQGLQRVGGRQKGEGKRGKGAVSEGGHSEDQARGTTASVYLTLFRAGGHPEATPDGSGPPITPPEDEEEEQSSGVWADPVSTSSLHEVKPRGSVQLAMDRSSSSGKWER